MLGDTYCLPLPPGPLEAKAVGKLKAYGMHETGACPGKGGGRQGVGGHAISSQGRAQAAQPTKAPPRSHPRFPSSLPFAAPAPESPCQQALVVLK